MNFNDGKSDIGSLSQAPEAKTTENAEEAGASKLDKSAMESATRAESRIHKNEQTNSSNTIFSK